MKSNQKLSILFWLAKAKAGNDGRAPIYVRVTIDGQSDELSLGRKITSQEWDSKNKKAIGLSHEIKHTNTRINQVRVDMERQFLLLQSQYARITPLMLKNAFLGLPVFKEKTNSKSAENPNTLQIATDFVINRFEKQVKSEKRSAETLKKWRTTKTKITEFLQFNFKKDDIDLSEIRYSFADDFYDYLTVHCSPSLQEATAKKYLKNTKHILKVCTDRDWLHKNPIQHFVCGGDDTDIPPLQLATVEALYKKEIEIKRLEEVRDVFIFQCFTGFAYQDVYGLTKDHIIEVGNTKEKWLIKNRGKTGVEEMVPILPVVEELISKYSNHPFCLINKRLLPVNSNARYNGYLKEIAAICHIKRSLNTHLARHTFADIMLNSGVPLEDVSKMLGHKSIRTTQRYAKVRKERISLNMQKVKILLANSGIV